MNKKTLSAKDKNALIETLQQRFQDNPARHKGIKWDDVLAKFEKSPAKLWSLHRMEETGGEPDVISYDKKADEYTFADCSPESPKGRRSLCYDEDALESRKQHKPKDSAMNLAADIGIDILTTEEYRQLQQLGEFDLKTSSWVATPGNIRDLGGALFCDCRYATVFTYHNGAESYYAARGFRGVLKV